MMPLYWACSSWAEKGLVSDQSIPDDCQVLAAMWPDAASPLVATGARARVAETWD